MPGGQPRIPRAAVDAILQGTARPSATSAPAASSPLAAKKASVEELQLDIAEEKAQTTLQQIRDEKQETKRRQEEQAQAKEDEQRRIREDDRRERQQRRREQEREQAAAQARRDFEDEKLGLAFSVLPQGLPEDVILDVRSAVREKLQDLYQISDDVVDPIVIAIARKACRPFIRSKEAERATANSLAELSFLARSYGGSPLTEWEQRALDLAMAAIDRLPETANFQEMDRTARAAGKHVAREYENSYSLKRLLPGLLRYSSPEKRTEAEEAVQDAFRRLSIGASDATFNAARDAALAPFVAAEAEAKTTHEAAAAKSRIEGQADLYLFRVSPYLEELERSADGWDFEGERSKYAERIRREIRPTLIQDLPLDLIAGYKRVEELVDAWLTAHV